MTQAIGGNIRKTIFDIRSQINSTVTGVTGNPLGRAAPVDPTSTDNMAVNGLGLGFVGANKPAEKAADGIIAARTPNAMVQNIRNRVYGMRGERQPDQAPVISEGKKSANKDMIFY